MRAATLKFAVVREDPEVELTLARRVGARRALVVASGGCTALSLAHALPGLEVVAYDLNPAQLAHVEAKQAAVAAGSLAALNVEDADPAGLSQRGAFEALFRVLRQAVVELVCPAAELERFFAPQTSAERRGLLRAGWVASPYWSAVFEVAFNAPLLEAMFGPDATQHAAPGSYPGYFQRVFERGLGRADAGRNPFLQHVFLGRYRAADAPAFLTARRSLAVTLREGSLLDVPGLGDFDLVHLSNIFDWSDDAVVTAWAQALGEALRPGAVVVTRQLNNQRPLRPRFGARFVFDDALGESLQAADRSLFYERIEVATRVEGGGRG